MRNFLLPPDYVRRKSYRTNPIYKSTWYVLLVLMAATAVFGSLYYIQRRSVIASKIVLESVKKEAAALGEQKTKLAQTQQQLDAIEIWSRNKRYSVAPFLAAIEKTIPDGLALSEIAIEQEGIEEEKRNVKIAAAKKAPDKKGGKGKEKESGPKVPTLIQTSANFIIVIRGVSDLGTEDKQHAMVDEWITALGKVIPTVLQSSKRYHEELAPKRPPGAPLPSNPGLPKFEITLKVVSSA